MAPPTGRQKFAIKHNSTATRVFMELSRDDLCRLRPGKWLNDEIINAAGNMINSDSSERFIVLSSFFMSKLSTEGYKGVSKWLSKVFDPPLVFCPNDS